VVDVLVGLLAAAILVPLGNWLYFKFSKPELEGGAAMTNDAGRVTTVQ